MGLLIFVTAVAPIEADVVMSLRTTDYSKSVPHIEETRMAVRPPKGESSTEPAQDPGWLKIDITSPRKRASATPPRKSIGSGHDHTLVFRAGDASSITVIDHRKKSFSVIDRASMTAFGTEMRMMMQSTAMRIEALPPEQQELARKVFESQLGIDRANAPPAPPGTVIKTSDRQTVNDWPCVKYEVFQNGVKLREVWVASADAVRGGEPVLTLLREMSDFYGSLIDTFGRIVPGFGSGLEQNPFDDLRRMHGFPVLTRNFAHGRVETEIALLSVTEKRLPAAEFEPPEGYESVVEGASESTQ